MKIETSEAAVERLHTASRTSARERVVIAGCAVVAGVWLALVRIVVHVLFDQPGGLVLEGIGGAVVGALSCLIVVGISLRRRRRSILSVGAMQEVSVTELRPDAIVVRACGRNVVLPLQRPAAHLGVGDQVWVPDPVEIGASVPVLTGSESRPDGVVLLPTDRCHPHRYR